MSIALDNLTEWLEPDGLGGYASGTTSGERTRRYHALLLTATSPPTRRMALVNGFDAWVESNNKRFAISTERYLPNVVYPDGSSRLIEFTNDPWPRWKYRIDEHTSITQELFVPHEMAACCLRWNLQVSTPSRSSKQQSDQQEVPPTLNLRPFFSGRDYHALHHENPAFRFEVVSRNGWLIWHPYEGVPGICLLTNASYSHDPQWFRNFLYLQEQVRGLDCVEDLASPGILRWDLSQDALFILATEGADAVVNSQGTSTEEIFATLAETQRQRRLKFASPLFRSADAYLVRRKLGSSTTDLRLSAVAEPRTGRTIIAGYPWFTDWGRDTFISLRGLCLATGRIDDACNILLAWAGTISDGMLPNRFPDANDQPEFNSVDASLWFIVAVHDLFETVKRHQRPIDTDQRQMLEKAILAIVAGYANGTRFGIRMDTDSLLTAGQPGMQLTWMDAKVGDWVVTPRIGKPVEVQSLWLNALWIAGRLDRRWTQSFNQGCAAFEKQFWNSAMDCLYDVVDVDHQSGITDAALRPNQIFAVGGLPLALLQGERARNVVDAVESRLLTPLGLRTLAPGSPNYAAHYHGNSSERDRVYHQGIVWPWLIGPFVEAWLRVRGGKSDAKAEARRRFLPPLEAHIHTTGFGHISEIADAESPFTPRGCPFQAWSLGEYLRLHLDVLAE